MVVQNYIISLINIFIIFQLYNSKLKYAFFPIAVLSKWKALKFYLKATQYGLKFNIKSISNHIRDNCPQHTSLKNDKFLNSRSVAIYNSIVINSWQLRTKQNMTK